MQDRVYIYVIGREEGPVKVGISTKPWGRLPTIQTGCPLKIELLFVRQANDRDHALYHERYIHLDFEEKRLAGEWFNIEAEDVIEQIESAFDMETFFQIKERLEKKWREKMQ